MQGTDAIVDHEPKSPHIIFRNLRKSTWAKLVVFTGFMIAIAIGFSQFINHFIKTPTAKGMSIFAFIVTFLFVCIIGLWNIIETEMKHTDK